MPSSGHIPRLEAQSVIHVQGIFPLSFSSADQLLSSHKNIRQQQNVARFKLCSEEVQQHFPISHLVSSVKTQQGSALGWAALKEAKRGEEEVTKLRTKGSGICLSAFKGLYPFFIALQS